MHGNHLAIADDHRHGRSLMISRKAAALLRSCLPATMRSSLHPVVESMSPTSRAAPLLLGVSSGRPFLHACTGPLPPPHRLRAARRGSAAPSASGGGWITDSCPCRRSHSQSAAASATATEQQTADATTRPRTELPKNFDPASEEQLYAWCVGGAAVVGTPVVKGPCSRSSHSGYTEPATLVCQAEPDLGAACTAQQDSKRTVRQ